MSVFFTSVGLNAYTRKNILLRANEVYIYIVCQSQIFKFPPVAIRSKNMQAMS